MAEENNATGTGTIAEAEYYNADAGSDPQGLGILRNYGLNPVINFSFMLRVEGIYDLPCRSVKSFHKENEFEYIQEGGLNDYVHLKRKPITKPFTFQVERYVGVDWLDPMPLGTELILPVILFVNKYRFSNATFKPVRSYAFTGCTVIAKDYGELNAEKSGLLTEITTIAYREMLCIDIPSEAMDVDTWSFDGRKKEGTGTRHYNQSSTNSDWETKKSKENMAEAAQAHRWTFAKKGAEEGPRSAVTQKEKSKADMEKESLQHRWTLAKEGEKEGPRSAATQEEKSKADMEKGAREWNFDKKAKAGKGISSANHSLTELQSTQGGPSAVEPEVKGAWNGKARLWPGQNSAQQIDSFLEPGREEPETGGEEKARLWTFPKDGEQEGPRSAVTQKEKTKEAMEAEGQKHLWSFPQGGEDEGTRSAVVQEEKTKAAMEAEGQKHLWAFPQGGEDEGARSAVTQEEKTKAAMEAEGRKHLWSFSSGDGGSAVQNEKEAAKEEMDKAAKEWKFVGHSKAGGGVSSANQSLSELQSTQGGPSTVEAAVKEAWAAKARRWPTYQSARQIAEFLNKK